MSGRSLRSKATAGLGLVVVSSLAIAGCQKKSSHAAPPEVTGLAAVPATAEVVIAADVGRILDAPLVDRAVDQLLLRDPTLAGRWQQLHDHCKVDIKQFKHVVLAIGPHDGPQPGTGPVLMVATGQLVETELAACVRAMVGQGGGSLTAKPMNGKTLYEAKDGNRVMYFAFGRPDTVILGSNEAFVTEALGTGKKVLDDPDLAALVKLADQRVPLWGAGKVDARVRDGLVKVMGGNLTAGPKAMVISFDPTHGAKLELEVVMASAADANALESFAKTQLGLMGMAAQAKGLGAIVDKIAISADQAVVRFNADLNAGDVNQLVSVLDGGGGSAQVSPPPNGSGASGP